MNLEVTLNCCHFNEKLRRAHRYLTHTDHQEPPYVFTHGIADFSTFPAHGAGLLLPTVHSRLVEPAQITDATERRRGSRILFR